MKCEFDDYGIVCGRCKHKLQSPGCLTCVRVQLPNLTQVFCTSVLFDPLSPEALEKFIRNTVDHCTNVKIRVPLTSGFGLSYLVEVFEAIPIRDGLLYSRQYKLNSRTRGHDATDVSSPCLVMSTGLKSIEAERKQCDSYLNHMLREYFDDIPRQCFRGHREHKIVQRQIIFLVYSYHLSTAQCVSLRF